VKRNAAEYFQPTSQQAQANQPSTANAQSIAVPPQSVAPELPKTPTMQAAPEMAIPQNKPATVNSGNRQQWTDPEAFRKAAGGIWMSKGMEPTTLALPRGLPAGATMEDVMRMQALKNQMDGNVNGASMFNNYGLMTAEHQAKNEGLSAQGQLAMRGLPSALKEMEAKAEQEQKIANAPLPPHERFAAIPPSYDPATNTYHPGMLYDKSTGQIVKETQNQTNNQEPSKDDNEMIKDLIAMDEAPRQFLLKADKRLALLWKKITGQQ
jgi:hypothetical protein